MKEAKNQLLFPWGSGISPSSKSCFLSCGRVGSVQHFLGESEFAPHLGTRALQSEELGVNHVALWSLS